MRTFFTVLVAIPYILTFWAAWLIWSFTGYPTDNDAIIETVRQANVHETVLDLIEESVREKVTELPDSRYADHVLSQSRAVIEDIVTEEWFYDTLGTAHEGLVTYLETGEDAAAIDMTGTKEKLRTFLLELGEEAARQCEESGGNAKVCAQVEKAGDVYDNYEERVLAALDEIPDEASVATLLGQSKEVGAPSKDLEEAREGLAQLSRFRLGAFGALACLLIIIALINMTSLKRVMISVGVVTLVASGSYLLSTSQALPFLLDEAKEAMAEESSADPDSIEGIAQDVATRVVLQGVENSIMRGTPPVTGVLVLSVLLIVGGVFVPQRTRRPA